MPYEVRFLFISSIFHLDTDLIYLFPKFMGQS